MSKTVKYRVKPFALWENPKMNTQIKGVPVSLCDEDLIIERPGVGGRPPFRMIAKKATQEQLKALFESGNPLIEAYEDEDSVVQLAAPAPPAIAEKKAVANA